MRIHLAVLLLTALFAAPSTADVLVVKRGNKYQFIGLPSKVNGVAVDIKNWRAFADDSKGIIEREGYNAVWAKKKAGKGKATRYPISEVVAIRYTTEPAQFVNGFDLMATGQWGRAVGAFRSVANDKEERAVYRIEAQYQIGRVYLAAGSRKQALEHFRQWTIDNSKFTPIVYRWAGLLLTSYKKYDEARQWFGKIGALEGITQDWKLKARLGGVLVDLAQKKFDDAENNAKAVVRDAQGDKRLNDALALAYALQGKAIFQTGNKDRYPDAQKALESAAGLDHVSDANMAVAYATLGDVIYAQGKPEAARFAYMRVACLFPNERDQAAHSLLNAGQCFLDLSDRAKDDADQRDVYLVKGMKLLRECAGRHRGRAPARAAALAFRRRKAAYEAALARIEAKQGGGEDGAGAGGASDK